MKNEAFMNSMYTFLAGYVLFFWACDIKFTLIWFFGCLFYGLKAASKQPSKGVDLSALKKYCDHAESEPWYNYQTHTFHTQPETLTVPKEVLGGDVLYAGACRGQAMNELFTRGQFHKEMCHRFFARENLTTAEWRNFKDYGIMPNRFGGEKSFVLKSWRHRPDFHIFEIFDEFSWPYRDKYPNRCYRDLLCKNLNKEKAIVYDLYYQANKENIFD